MTMISIGTLNFDSTARDSLLQEIGFLNREGLSIQISEKDHGKYHFLNCSLEESGPTTYHAEEKILRYYLANIITDLLMNDITKEAMIRLLKNKYHYFRGAELGQIIQKAYSYLNNCSDEPEFERALFHHNQILDQVSDYLEANSSLFLEGFLRFRLKSYFNELENSLESAVDNFLVEREYNEFIKLLRYFVEIQEPRLDEVNVLFQDDINFYLLDETCQPIDQQQLYTVLAELNQEVDYDDLLLSALITISPRKIVLHILKEIEIVDTIVNVFQERVVFCPGCKICESRKLHNVLNEDF